MVPQVNPAPMHDRRGEPGSRNALDCVGPARWQPLRAAGRGAGLSAAALAPAPGLQCRPVAVPCRPGPCTAHAAQGAARYAARPLPRRALAGAGGGPQGLWTRVACNRLSGFAGPGAACQGRACARGLAGLFSFRCSTAGCWPGRVAGVLRRLSATWARRLPGHPGARPAGAAGVACSLQAPEAKHRARTRAGCCWLCRPACPHVTLRACPGKLRKIKHLPHRRGAAEYRGQIARHPGPA